jgi:rubrerythrin
MNIFKFAMQMENEAEAFYRRLANNTENAGLKIIFDMLADEEAKHFKIVEEMKAKIPNKISSTNVLSEAKGIFEQMSNTDKKTDVNTSQIEVYRKAQAIEKKSIDFYLKKADEVEEHCQEGIFRKLAEEEKKHYFLLQNIIEFVSRPENWLENAEWHHLEEY